MDGEKISMINIVFTIEDPILLREIISYMENEYAKNSLWQSSEICCNLLEQLDYQLNLVI